MPFSNVVRRPLVKMRSVAKNVARRLLVKMQFVTKQEGELGFWREQMEELLLWHQGLLARRRRPPPEEEQKVTCYSPVENAIWTWRRLHGFRKYPQALKVPADFFAGMKLLDVGCGPLPYALGFENCEIWGLDQLIEQYLEVGYPLTAYDKRAHYVSATAEYMPFADHCFDAVISVNAIDHVDDFAAAAAEIRRVLKPGGILRMQVHYHKPTATEPWALSDETVLEHFHSMGLEKMAADPVPVFEGRIGALWALANKRREERVVWGCGTRATGRRT